MIALRISLYLSIVFVFRLVVFYKNRLWDVYVFGYQSPFVWIKKQCTVGTQIFI